MKPTEFLLNEGTNGFCPACKCNTSTGDSGECKLCGTPKQVAEATPAEQTRLSALREIGQKMMDVNNIFSSAKRKGDADLMGAARQKLAALAKQKQQLEAQAQLNDDVGVDEGVLPDWAADILNQEIAATKKTTKTIAPTSKNGDPRPVNNFEPEDIKALEKITDIPTLKSRCMALISNSSQHQMKPEKVSWFARRIESLNSRMAIIKLMYDLLLAGEGHQVIGTKGGMGKNSYRQRFGESDGGTCSASVATGPAGNLFAQPQKRVKEGAKKKTTVKESWEEYYSSTGELANEILNFVQKEFGGEAWFKGDAYAYKISASNPKQMVASDGSVIDVRDVAQGLSDYCEPYEFDAFVESDPVYWREFFRPVKKKTPMARDGAPMYGSEQERHELGRMRGESKQSNILSGITLAETQLNELKPKIIPKTLAGGKLNPNHPGNAEAIALEKEAKYKRQERARQERIAQTARRQEQAKRQREKEKARKAGEKAKKALGNPAPTNPLEKKAKDAMWKVWNAIAPDMMQAIRGGGYDEDEDLLEDPFWLAEVCCDANHMQTFAHLSPEEEREILDNLDQKTLARLASDFGI